MDDEVNNSRQDQLAKFDTKSANRQEVLQVRVREALGDTASDLDNPLGVILVVLNRPQRILWIHDDTKSCGVHAEGRLHNATTASKRSDIVELQRCAFEDV